MDEEVTRRKIWAFYCPNRVLEWVGRLPAKIERGCSHALVENIIETEGNGLTVSYSGSPSLGSVI